MTNTLVTPEQLVSFAAGELDDELVDVAAAAVRRDAGWHIAPRVTETILVACAGGRELWLPTRAFPAAPVVVTAVRNGTASVDTWETLPGVLWRRQGWPAGVLQVTLTHGLDACPLDLFPLIAQRAEAATSRRDQRVRSFTNGGVQMSFGDAYQLDPELSHYAVIGGVS